MADNMETDREQWLDIPCSRCMKKKITKWDKRCSLALGYKALVCEDCISKDYDLTVDELQEALWEHFRLTPSPSAITVQE